MKTSTLVYLCVAALGLFLPASNISAVTLTVSPSVTSNTYAGPITVDIAGLTNGQPVTLQTYMDVNGNGVVDPGEPLLDAFKLKDGGVTIIGGVTNLSVPYDANSATGEITTSFSFAPPLENLTGQRIYRVISNPTGAFTPVTATLNVTNSALGQSVSGVVYSNGIAPLPNAVVAVLTVTNTDYVGSVVADANGHYFMTLPPGNYLLLPAYPGFYTDQSLLPMVNLTNGTAATNDLSLTNGAVSVTGQVYDAGNSNALGGIFVQLQSGSLFEVAFTDTNGNYFANVSSNNWKIRITADRLGSRGFVAPQNTALLVNATLGDVTGANIGLYKGNSMFYGRVTIGSTPVPNIPVECNDNSQIFNGKSYTDTNGYFGVPVIVNTNALPDGTTWGCSVNTGSEVNTILANYVVNLVNSIVFTANEAYLINFDGLPVTGTIMGRLVNDAGVPLAGISINANATINSMSYGTSTIDTDTNGTFSLGAAGGQWYVSANCCGNHGLDSQGYYDPFDGTHVVNLPPNATMNITAYPIGQPVLNQAERISSSQFGFNLGGSAGNNYTIQANTNLASTNWVNLMIISNFPGNAQFIQDNNATNRQQFYRVMQGP